MMKRIEELVSKVKRKLSLSEILQEIIDAVVDGIKTEGLIDHGLIDCIDNLRTIIKVTESKRGTVKKLLGEIGKLRDTYQKQRCGYMTHAQADWRNAIVEDLESILKKFS